MTVPENNIEILLFPPVSEDSAGEINAYLNDINAIVDNYSKDYLWHVDKLIFPSSCINNHSNTFTYEKYSLPPFIYSSLHFGENVEDEWFIVYIMLQVSREIPGLIIRLWDSDGEFLLIEAANHLPKWCNPESCFEKVFLFKENIHIIENCSKGDATNKDEDSPNLKKMLDFIRNNENKTKANSEVQNEIKSKIQGYPDKIQDQIHYAHAYIPVSISKIVQVKPHLIAHATRAFCLRDALDMKAVKNFPHFSSQPKIMKRIRFTKCLYAMLMSTQYVHPSIPVISNTDHKPHSIGARLMCGFEILLSQVQDREGKCEKQWNEYLSSLHKKGYFKDLLEGSKEFKELESMAREFFLKNQVGDLPERTIGNEIEDILQDLTIEITPNEPLLPADDDSWMSISSLDLDQILQERFGLKGENCSGPEHQDLVSSAINRFLHHSSGLEGAEFPHGDNDNHVDDDQSEEAPKSINTTKTVRFEGEDSAMDVSSDDLNCDNIDFNLDEFSAAINKMLDTFEQKAGVEIGSDGESDSSVSGSDSDDYMKAMTEELSGTTLAESFVKKENDDSVDIDMNALQNVIQSYEAQIGSAGPASNVLTPMGINIRSLLDKKKNTSDSSQTQK